jgi:PTS system mannose-specific IIB component/fructoselysine and glucoselysine-specific PTS system IIB component
VSWALIRVDDRLVHGQVVVAWGGRLHPQRIVVADDPAASSAWERDLLTSGAPGVEIQVLGLADTAEMFAREAGASGTAFLVLRDLAGALELVRRGVRPARINLGGLHYAAGKQKVNDYIYLDAADRAAVRELRAAGVTLEVQDVPSTRPVALAELGVEEAR